MTSFWVIGYCYSKVGSIRRTQDLNYSKYSSTYPLNLNALYNLKKYSLLEPEAPFDLDIISAVMLISSSLTKNKLSSDAINAYATISFPLSHITVT